MIPPDQTLAALLASHLWVSGAVFVLILLLLRVARREHKSILRVAWFFGACSLGLGVGATIHLLGFRESADLVCRLALLGNGICVIRLVCLAVFRVFLPVIRLQTPQILEDIVVASAGILWLLLWLRGHRVDLSSLVAPSAIVTAVIGLSLQDTIGNILGGVALQFEDTIRVGDWVKVDDIVGRVSEVRWRQTSLETRNWETVVIPNSQLLKSKFTVLGRRQGQPVQLRRWVWFHVDLAHLPSRVIDTVLGSLRSTRIPGVAEEPPPSCVLMDISDGAGKYAVRYWLTDIAADDPTDGLVRANVHVSLMRAGIELVAAPHAVRVTEDTPKRVRRREQQAIEARVAAVRDLELFRTLKPEELQQIARRLVPAPFQRGEVMTRQGAKAHWLYVVIDGWADVMLERPDGPSVKLSEIGPSSFFGEMGLLTGEPRTATVIARSDVDCYRLDKEAFHDILHARPELAGEISNLLRERTSDLHERMKRLDAQDAAHQEPASSHDLLSRIREFFGLPLN